MNTYDAEAIVLGMTLRWGKEASQIALPQLTPDKFVHNFNGSFGPNHSIVWEAIRDVFLNKRQTPSFTSISDMFNESEQAWLQSLVGRVEHHYLIKDFDKDEYIRLINQVDKSGVVYNIAQVGGGLGTIITDTESLDNTLSRIDDVESWAAEQLGKFQSTLSLKGSGYQHISSVIGRLKDRWEMQLQGEMVALLHTGIDALTAENLIPVGKMTVLHGLSGSGKSTLAFQMAVGVAISLYLNGIKGCVAINSLEMTDEDLVERVIGILAGVDVSGFMSGKIKREDYNLLKYWAGFAAQLPIFIDPTNFITTSAMEYRASGLHLSSNGPVMLLVSDYGELFHDDDKLEEQRVARIFRNQFNTAHNLGCAVLAISQSTPNNEVGTKSRIAGPDGTRYSRAVRQAADFLGELWNPEQIRAAGQTVVPPEGLSDEHPYLFIQKFRGGAVGAAIPLQWEASTTTFADFTAPGVIRPFSHLQDARLKYDGSTW